MGEIKKVKKVIMMFLGCFFISVSLSFLIIYLNLFTLGYSFWDYIHFISRRVEVQIGWVGVILLIKSRKKKVKDDALLL